MMPPESRSVETPVDRDSPVRAGLVVTAGTFAGHLGNYLFYMLAARLLGPASFAEVSALVAFATLVTQPFTGIQAAAARDIARLRAGGGPGMVGAYLARLLKLLASATGVVLAILLGASPLLTRWLKLESTTVTVVAVVWIAAWGAAIVGVGVMQGMNRFGQVAWLMGGPLGMLRAALLIPFVLWAGVIGSMTAMLLAALVGLVSLVPTVRKSLRCRSRDTVGRRPQLGLALVTLLAFASLTNADVLIAKAVLPPVQAGLYSSAVLLGKISLFAPLAIAMILLPRAASILETGGDARRLLWGAQAATLGMGVVITAAWLLLPPAVIRLTFGPSFLAAKALIVPLSATMTMAALLNVGISYALALHRRRFSVALVLGAVLHIVLLAVFAHSPASLIAVSAISIGATLVVTELLTGHGALSTLLPFTRSLGRAR
jgi:O-antigen/teichoic acid export membrane protein